VFGGNHEGILAVLVGSVPVVLVFVLFFRALVIDIAVRMHRDYEEYQISKEAEDTQIVHAKRLFKVSVRLLQIKAVNVIFVST
jgi:hypothetical protein